MNYRPGGGGGGVQAAGLGSAAPKGFSSQAGQVMVPLPKQTLQSDSQMSSTGT
ncbi:hypothetical protein KP001_03860 [Geomonas subterranea]|uniref:Uncharacterized protein n=1 Tax=Geomonas subterranea TaxID=2847989 RepID=A0ABX8LI22_9BACT|nr:hypothetical protein [Geomonas subterranea]QXE91685.1 hypothetical protein KP001_03860 [Geomonas subterranea]QXM10221.1 hypothetical protein KP002_03635 [Geomonas subterranea]